MEIKECFCEKFGATLRACIDCGTIVYGGPTRCVRCAEQSTLNMFQKIIWKLLGIWYKK